MSKFLLMLVVSAVGAAATITVAASANGTAAANPLKTIRATGSGVEATFVLPASMVAYSLHFDTKNWGGGAGADHETDFVLPGLPIGNGNSTARAVNFGTTTATSWVSNPAGALVLYPDSGNPAIVWSVHLDYAARATCKRVGHCPGIRHSGNLTLTINHPQDPAAVAAANGATGPSPTAKPSNYGAEQAINAVLSEQLPNFMSGAHESAIGSLVWKGTAGSISCMQLTDTLFKCSWLVEIDVVSYSGRAMVTFYKYAPNVVLSQSTCVDAANGAVCAQQPAPANG